jgi:hypothetical protein
MFIITTRITEVTEALQLTHLASLHAITKFGFANSFASTETTTVSNLAKTVGLNSGDTDQLVRHPISYLLLLEPSPGVIFHSAISSALANVPLLNDWVSSPVYEIYIKY